MSLQTDLSSPGIPAEIPGRDALEGGLSLEDLVIDDSLPKVQVQLLSDGDTPGPRPSTLLSELQCEV